MFRFAYADQNTAMNASAAQAEAASCCASHASSFSSSFSCIKMGAIVMASILICTLRLSGLSLPVLVWAAAIMIVLSISLLLWKGLAHGEQER